MKTLGLVLGFCLLTSFVFADVTADVLSYEKEIISGKSIIKVTTEYTYPDGTKHTGVTRYGYHNFSKANVEKDVQRHCETITKYYIKENAEIQATRKNEMIDEFITTQDNLPDEDKITKIKYTLKNLYLEDLDITIPATGTTKDEHK